MHERGFRESKHCALGDKDKVHHLVVFANCSLLTDTEWDSDDFHSDGHAVIDMVTLAQLFWFSNMHHVQQPFSFLHEDRCWQPIRDGEHLANYKDTLSFAVHHDDDVWEQFGVRE